MLRVNTLFVICTLLFSCSEKQQDRSQKAVHDFPDIWSTYKLFYDQPAEEWNQALPVGNGSLGAMIYGRVEHELIQFNEETLWTGGPYDASREGGAEALPEIQRLVFAGEYAKAHDLFGL